MKKIDTKKTLSAEVGAKQIVEIDESIKNLELLEFFEGRRVVGKLTIINLDETLLAKGDFVAGVVLVCDRCLRNFKTHVPFYFERDYKISRLKQLKEELFVDKLGQIDITDPIREEIILNIPLHNYCDIDCAGICQGCGINLNEKKCCCKNNKNPKTGVEGRR